MNENQAIEHFGGSEQLYRFEGSREELTEFMSSLAVSYSYLLGDACFVRTATPISDERLVPVTGSI